jgi:hypothetical protein
MRGLSSDRRVFLGGVAASLAAGSVSAQVRIERRGPSMIPDGSDYQPPETLKAVFDLCRRMTAPVRINGHGPYPFVVDTGANQSVVSAGLAAELGLSRGPLELLNSTTGSQLAPTTRARLSIGERVEGDVLLSILPADPMGGLGMLGVDRLAGQRLTLDFAHQRLVIEDATHAQRNPNDVVMQARRREGQLTLVDADLAGSPVIAFLDSGAQSTIGNLALKALATSQRPHTTWNDVPVVSVTGQTVTAAMASVPALRIGGLRLPAWPVAFADLHAFSLWNLIDQPALMIGVDVLSRFNAVSLDFARSEVRFHNVAAGWSTMVA